MPNPLTTAVARMSTTVRSWLGNWPMSEFGHVFGGGPTTTGVPVSEFTALNYSAVWSAVSVIAADVASLPLVLYKRTEKDGKDRFLDSKLYELLHDAPNPEMGSMVFREALQAHVMTWGNAYAEIQRDDLGRPVALWPITPDRVSPFRDGPQLKYRVTNPSGSQNVLLPRDMLHVPGLGFDGVTGYSVIQKARESISLGLATEQFGGTFFGNGSTFGGVLSYKEKLTAEVKQGIRESIDASHTGVQRAHKFIILGGDVKYDKLGIPPNDAQFLETRRFQVTEIARWFQIPPHKLGDLERATFSNIEQQDIEYYRSCLRRWLVRWEQELNRKLIPPLERKQQFFKHNVEGFLRGDSAARSAFYTSMCNLGVYSINMVLEAEDLNKIGTSGDGHLVQGNLVPVDRLLEPPPEPKPEPVVTDEPIKQIGDGAPTRAIEELAEDISLKVVEIQSAITAQRSAETEAERAELQATIDRLQEEHRLVQQRFDEFRAQHASDAERLTAEVDAARQETAAERAAREATEAARRAAEAAQAEAVVQAAEATQAREAAEKRAAEEAAALADAKDKATQAMEAATQRAATAAAEAGVIAQEALDARAKHQAAEKAAEEAAAALTSQRQAEIERLTGMLSAHRALILDAMQRILAPEIDRARKHQATPAKLRAWAEAFYLTHEDRCIETLRPAIRVHLAWKGDGAELDTVTRELARAHVDESRGNLLAILQGEPEEMHAHLEALLRRWEQDRPDAMADRILIEEINHVRSLR